MYSRTAVSGSRKREQQGGVSPDQTNISKQLSRPDHTPTDISLVLDLAILVSMPDANDSKRVGLAQHVRLLETLLCVRAQTRESRPRHDDAGKKHLLFASC